MKRITVIPFAALLALAALAQAQDPIGFTVRIENVSTADTLNTSSGTVPVPLAPGVWVLHQDGDALFSNGESDRGQGLEAIAEDGDPSRLLDYLSGAMMAGDFGVFNTPVGADGPGPLLPGGVYAFNFEALPGSHLSFATMFVQSNDLFYAPEAAGIALFDADGEPIHGDISELVLLWDAGTEVDEEPGTGANQAPRQAGPDSGADQNGVVSLLMMGDSPDTNGPVIRVTIEQDM
jgi:hypothetical protein